MGNIDVRPATTVLCIHTVYPTTSAAPGRLLGSLERVLAASIHACDPSHLLFPCIEATSNTQANDVIICTYTLGENMACARVFRINVLARK